VKLIYGPVNTRVVLDDPFMYDDFFRSMQVPNPAWGEEDDAPQYIEFFDREEKEILTGHIPLAKKWAAENEFCVEIDCADDFGNIEVDENILPGVTLRPYQLDALKRALVRGRGVLEIATGGGKTEIAIALVAALGVPRTVYVCPDTASCDEMYFRFIKRGFTEEQVGRLGAGRSDLDRPVVIAVINSLYSGIKRSKKEVLDVLHGAELFFADEVHHQATAFSWQAVAAECRAPRRIGMSGTPYKDNNSRFNPLHLHIHDSWLTGYLGDTLVYIPPSELQQRKQLTNCRVYSFMSGGGYVKGKQWHTVYDKGIVKNDQRNYRIGVLSANLVDQGRRPLISVEKLDHGRFIQKVLKDYFGINAICSYGSGVAIVPIEFARPYEHIYELNPVKYTEKVGRKKKVEKTDPDYVYLPSDFPFKEHFERGELSVLIGSRIYDEALDIPCLTDLINAAGGKAQQRFRQKVGRVLRLFKNKTLARIWEPYDDCHYYLENHSKKRIQTARDEGYEIFWAPALMTDVRFTDLNIQPERYMKLNQIRVDVGMTINCGDFNSIRPGVSLSAELEDGDDAQTCYEELSAQATALFFREAFSQATHLGQTVEVGIEAACMNYLSYFKKDA
jgi:hypothetical protein